MKNMKNKGTFGKRLDTIENQVKELQKNVKVLNDILLEDKIIKDLNKPKFEGCDSNKFLYTYQEISNKHHVTKSRVQKIAEYNNLTRRKYLS